MKEYAEQAALVSSLLGEVKALVPIADDTVQEGLLRLFIENGPQVHLEICSVLATRADSFRPQDLSALKVVMDTHCGPRPIQIIDAAMSKLEGQKEEASVDLQELQVLMRQPEYDVMGWRTHQHT